MARGKTNYGELIAAARSKEAAPSKTTGKSATKAAPSKSSTKQPTKPAKTQAKPSKTELLNSKTPRVQTSKKPASRPVSERADNAVQDEIPLYQRLIPKEARLRESDLKALNFHARRLNRAKPKRGGERITENTLIRAAVRVLLGRALELDGVRGEDDIVHRLKR